MILLVTTAFSAYWLSFIESDRVLQWTQKRVKKADVNVKEEKSDKHAITEKIFAPFALLFGGSPTNPYAVPLSVTAPEGLALVHSAANPPEAALISQILQNAGFLVEYVPPATTGAFGTSGSRHVYVHANQKQDACEFLSQLLQAEGENRNTKSDME